MNHMDKNDEYIAFWAKFLKNAEEIINEYNKLSDENKQRANMEAYRILMLQGYMGVLEYAKSLQITI